MFSPQNFVFRYLKDTLKSSNAIHIVNMALHFRYRPGLSPSQRKAQHVHQYHNFPPVIGNLTNIEPATSQRHPRQMHLRQIAVTTGHSNVHG